VSADDDGSDYEPVTIDVPDFIQNDGQPGSSVEIDFIQEETTKYKNITIKID